MIDFLPGVAVDHVLSRLAKAGGNEINSGKFASPESSAALAVNTFGWFIDRPVLLPPFPGLNLDLVAAAVDVEYCARFPWTGGRHPWLDAVIETPRHIVGVESKRFEPYRDRKSVSLSPAYDRPVWGNQMTRYEAMRDALRSGDEKFELLDAAQLVKHAFGLITNAARKGKDGVLVYLFAEPPSLNGRLIDFGVFVRHRTEIARFVEFVTGSAIQFHALSYREWLSSWPADPPAVREHAEAVLMKFNP